MDQVLKIGLDLDAGRYFVTAAGVKRETASLERAMDDLARAARNTDQVVDRMGGTFRQTILTLGALRFAMMDVYDVFFRLPKMVLETAGEFERLETMMRGLSQSTSDVVRQLEGVRDMNFVVSMSKTAPFEIKAIADAFVKLKVGALDPASGTLQTLLNSVAKFGGTSETLKRASVALQQMSGKGVVSMEELRQQLGEAIPNAIELMARGMGKSQAELTALVSKGIVQSRNALAKMFAQMELDSAGAAEAMMRTIPGAMSALKTEFSLFQNEIAKGGFNTAVTEAMRGLTAFLQSDDGARLAKDLGDMLRQAVEGLVAFSKAAYEAMPVLKALGVVLLSLYGGARLAGLHANWMEKSRAQRQELERVQAAARAAVQEEENRLRSANRARAEEMASLNRWAKEKEALQQRQLAAARMIDQQQRSQIKQQNALLQEQIVKQTEIERQRRAASTQSPAGLFSPRAGGSKLSDAEAEALRKASVEVSANTEAIARRIEALRAENEATSRKLRALTASNSAYAVNREAIRQSIQQHREAIRENNKKIQSLRDMTIATNTAGAAVMGFFKNLGASVAYGLAFYAAIEALALIWDRVTKSAREAEAAQNRAMRAKQDAQTEDDLKFQIGQMEELAKRREDLLEQRAQFQSALDGTRISSAAERQAARRGIPEIDRELAQIRQAAPKLQKELEAARKVVLGRRDETAASNLTQSFARELSQELAQTDVAKSYRSLESGLAALEAKPGVKPKEIEDYRKKFVEAGVKLQEEKLAIIDRLEKDFLTRAGETSERTLNAVAEQISGQRNSTNKMLAELRKGDQLNTAKKKPGEGLGAGIQAETKSPYDGFIDKIKTDLAQLQSEVATVEDGVVTVSEIYQRAVARVQALAASGKLDVTTGRGKNKKTRAPNQTEIDQAIDLTALEMQVEQAKRAWQTINQLRGQIEQDSERVDEAFASAEMVKPPRAVLQMEKAIARLAPMRAVLEQQIKGFNWDAFTSEMRQGAGKSALAEEYARMADEVRSINASMVTDDEEKQREITRNQIEQIKARERVYLASLGSMMFWSKDTADKAAAYQKMTADLITAMLKDLEFRTRSPVQQMADQWAQGMRNLRQASANWMDSFVNDLVDGRFKFSEFVQSILADIAKIKLRETMSEGISGLMDSFTAWVGETVGLKGAGKSKTGDARGYDAAKNAQRVTVVDGDLPGGVPDPQSEAGPDGPKGMVDKLMETMGRVGEVIKTVFDSVMRVVTDGLSSLMSSLGSVLSSSGGGGGGFLGTLGTAIMSMFAKGGVMTGAGPLQLRKYAQGGIAKSPQLALYGEGSRPEAYVPLPDGRTIPVTMQGQPAAQTPPQVTVNVINQSGAPVSAQQGQPRFDGKRMVLDVVLSAVNTPGPFRDSLKNAMK